MAGSTRCPGCWCVDVTSKHRVEKTWLHPAMGPVLGLVTAEFVASNTGGLLMAMLVAGGIALLPMLGPVRTRILGVGNECRDVAIAGRRPLARPGHG